MNRPIRILLLEHNTPDAEKTMHSVSASFVNCSFQLAMNKKEFLAAMDGPAPEIILSEKSLSEFEASEALEIARLRYPFVPFILVTEKITEEFAKKIIKEDADDYILKNRLTMLPAAMKAAIEHRRTQKEFSDYRYAVDQSAIVAITDQKGIITYANENFCNISKYSSADLIGKDHRIINSEYHPKDYIRNMWVTIANGKTWRGEFRNRASDGTHYWVDTTIVPFLYENGKPYQYLSIRYDITDKKELERKLIEQQRIEQVKITATALEAQEKERTAIGRELHDNVNQILVAARMLIDMGKHGTTNTAELMTMAANHIHKAIEENRKIAHSLVTPDLHVEPLIRQLNSLTASMLSSSGIEVKFDSDRFDETFLNDAQKLAIYRIAQEQCTNIIKYAKAGKVTILLASYGDYLEMKIQDDGVGTDPGQFTNGIGLKNITARLSVFNGKAAVKSSPGKGFSLEITMPV